MATTTPQTGSVLSLATTAASATTYDGTTVAENDSFQRPAYTHFPPFYTLQPNLQTQSRQLTLWSTLITDYCAYHKLFRLSLSSPPQDLFQEPTIKRSLNQNDIKKVIDWMTKPENGGRAEWIPSTTKGAQPSTCYIYWRTPTEWADLIYAWIDETGQKGTILTLYELRESDAVSGKGWQEMDEDLLRKVLNVLVKRGKAQIFGQEETSGIKFF